MLSRYASHTFYPFNYANMQTLRVKILIYIIALYALVITWLFEWIECMLYAMFVKLNLMFSWKRFRMQLRYANPLFMKLSLFFLSIPDLLINCHASLMLVSRDLFHSWNNQRKHRSINALYHNSRWVDNLDSYLIKCVGFNNKSLLRFLGKIKYHSIFFF